MKRSNFLISTTAAGAAVLAMEPTTVFARTVQQASFLKVENVPSKLSLARQVLLVDTLPADYAKFVVYEKDVNLFCPVYDFSGSLSYLGGQSSFILPTFSYARAGQSFASYEEAANFESKLLVDILNLGAGIYAHISIAELKKGPFASDNVSASLLNALFTSLEKNYFTGHNLLMNEKTFNKYQFDQFEFYDAKKSMLWSSHVLFSNFIVKDVIYLTTQPGFVGPMPIRPSNSLIRPNEISMAIINKKGIVKTTIHP